VPDCRPVARTRCIVLLCCVSRPARASLRTYWPNTRLVRVSDRPTTSARCHAVVAAHSKPKLRIVALGARSWIRRVASCRSKCNRWVKVSTCNSQLNSSMSRHRTRASVPATSFSFASVACSNSLPPSPSAQHPPCWFSRSLRSHSLVDSVGACSVHIPNLVLHRRLIGALLWRNNLHRCARIAEQGAANSPDIARGRLGLSAMIPTRTLFLTETPTRSGTRC
jgi:hypothetical protein